MRVVWSDPAHTDFAAIESYIADEDINAAERVGAAILAAATSLGSLAERGRKGKHPGTRELLVPRLPYYLVYEIAQDTVTILRVIHAKRDWPRRP